MWLTNFAKFSKSCFACHGFIWLLWQPVVCHCYHGDSSLSIVCFIDVRSDHVANDDTTKP